MSQLESLYDKIEQAVDQVSMVHVMEASTGVLQNLSMEIGGVTNVENVVVKLKEEMDAVDGIGSIIESARLGDAAIDESAIDNELEALLWQGQLETEEKEARRTQERLDDIGAPDDKKQALQLSGQNTKIRLIQPAEIDDLAVTAFDRMSLDERQPPNKEISQTPTKEAEALSNGIPRG